MMCVMNYGTIDRLEREQSDKNFARAQVRYALKKGTLKRESCICGEVKVDAHHGDYKKPLDVIWLCRKHHAEVHTTRNRADMQEYLGSIE